MHKQKDYPTFGNFVLQSLKQLSVDDVVRFPRGSSGTVHAKMEDLRLFGADGQKFYYGSVIDKDTDEMVVVRLK